MHHASKPVRRPSALHMFSADSLDLVGGPLAVIRNIFGGLKESFAISVLVRATATQRRDIVVNDLQATNEQSFGSAMSLPKALALPWRLLRQIATHDLLALHVPFPLAELAVVLGASRCKPLVVHWHGEAAARAGRSRLRDLLLRQALRRAEAIVVADRRIPHETPLLKEHAHKCRIVPFGIDASRLDWPNLVPGRVNDRGRLVLACGPLLRDKGFDVLVRAAVGRQFGIWIVGEGPERIRLQQLIDELGLTERVRLLGALPDSERLKLMCIADVFAMPSRTNAEAFGLVQLEAMAAGRPVVNTALDTAVPRVARHGIEAITVTPDDAAQFGDAIDALIRDPERRRHMSRAARARVVERFSAAAFRTAMEIVYREALTAHAKCPTTIRPSSATP